MLRSKESCGKLSLSKESTSKESMSKESTSKESLSKESGTKVSRSKENRSLESGTKDTRSKDTRTKDSRSVENRRKGIPRKNVGKREIKRNVDMARYMLWRHNEGQHGHQQLIEYNPRHIMRILKDVKRIFARECPLQETEVPAVVIGDLHGQYEALMFIITLFRKETEPKMKYVFLGDYVDRGNRSLEVILVLFSLKILLPRKYILLRGNHECRHVTYNYGFRTEIEERFPGAVGKKIYNRFDEVFGYMPVACRISQRILCMHGGIGPSITSLDDIKLVPKPLRVLQESQVATDLMWADPMMGAIGFLPNTERGTSVFFGEDVLIEFQEKHKIDLFIRGHQMMRSGYGYFANHRLLTVFSAPRYGKNMPNAGAVVHIDETGRVTPKVFNIVDMISMKVEAPRNKDKKEIGKKKKVKKTEDNQEEEVKQIRAKKKGDDDEYDHPPNPPDVVPIKELIDNTHYDYFRFGWDYFQKRGQNLTGILKDKFEDLGKDKVDRSAMSEATKDASPSSSEAKSGSGSKNAPKKSRKRRRRGCAEVESKLSSKESLIALNLKKMSSQETTDGSKELTDGSKEKASDTNLKSKENTNNSPKR